MILENDLAKIIIDAVTASGDAGLGNNYARMLNTMPAGKWNGDLRVKQNNAHKGMLHSWMTTVITDGQKRQGQRMNHYWGWRIRGVIQTWDNGDLDNSEIFVRKVMKEIKRYFALHPNFDLDQAETGFLKHDEIQVTNRAIQFAGQAGAHVINLFLGTHLYENLPNS